MRVKSEGDVVMGVFDGCQLTLELDSGLPFKKKLELKKNIFENGGIVSFIVTKKVAIIIIKLLNCHLFNGNTKLYKGVFNVFINSCTHMYI